MIHHKVQYSFLKKIGFEENWLLKVRPEPWYICGHIHYVAARRKEAIQRQPEAGTPEENCEYRMVTNFDRGQIDERVRESPDFLAGIIGSAMDAIIAVDDAQRIVLFNSAAEKMFVCTEHEAIGNSVERFIPERFRAEHSTHVRRFAESGVTNRKLGGLGTRWGLRATGEEFPIEASISKVESSGRKFFAVVVRDITEYHRAEEALRESEQRFRLVADTAPILLWMSGTDKLCTYFNKPWLDFTGRAMEEELGNGWAEGVHPDDLQECLQTYSQFFDRRQKFKMEYRLRRHDGEYRWIFDIGVPRFNHDGSFAGYIGTCIDITDRKLAEQTLRESEERFRLAAQAGKMFAYEWDVATDVIVRSPEAPRMLGMDEGAQTTGQQVMAQVHPDDRDRLTAAVAALSLKKPFLKISYRIVRPDGTVIWVERNSCAHFDEQGRMLRVVGMVADITDRKLAEESRFKHAAVVESSDDAIISKDLNGVITSWNAGAQNIFGYMESEVIGRPITILIPPELLGEESKILERLRAAERIEHYETVRVTKTGTKINVSLTISPIKDSSGKVVGASKIARDITQRKLAEEALRKSEERLRLALQAGKIYAYEWDVATDLIVRSGDIASVLGSTSEPSQTRRQLLARIHPDDRAIFNASVTERTPENPDVQISYRLLRSDGSVIWLEKTAHAFFDGQGRMLRMIGMMADISDHKLAEEALFDMNRRLIQAQEQERTRIARDLHDDVSQRLALLAIRLQQLPHEVQSRAQELHEEVVEISNNVQSLSHDLHSSQLEYLGVVAGMMSWCREFGERQGMQIEYRHDVRSIPPREVGLCLFRVLQEALNNAVKHSGVKRIEAQLHEDAGEIHLIVSDSGRGFDMKQALAGKGLGLTSMRERVRLVNGTIAIDSKPMHGTTIHVRVPIASEQSQRVAV